MSLEVLNGVPAQLLHLHRSTGPSSVHQACICTCDLQPVSSLQGPPLLEGGRLPREEPDRPTPSSVHFGLRPGGRDFLHLPQRGKPSPPDIQALPSPVPCHWAPAAAAEKATLGLSGGRPSSGTCGSFPACELTSACLERLRSCVYLVCMQISLCW